MATDSSGNLIVAGQIAGTLDYGGGNLTSRGGSDVFIAKLDPSGRFIWARRFGDSASFQSCHAVAVDGSGSIVAVGEFEGGIDFGTGPLTSAGGSDIFVVKLDGNGNTVYGLRFGDAAHLQVAHAVAIDPSGDAIVVGAFEGTVDLGLGTGPLAATGASDAFVVKLDPGGNVKFARSFGGDASVKLVSVALDSASNIVLGGQVAGTVDFGGGPITSAGGADILLVKLSPSGGYLLAKRFGDSAARQRAIGVAVDSADNVVLGASFEGTVSFGGGDLVNTGALSFDIGIAKFDPGGNHLWSKSFGDGAGQNLSAIASASDDHVLLTGQFKGSLDFGGGPLAAAPYVMFLAELDAGGAYVAARRLGVDAGDFVPSALLADGQDSLVAGRFYGIIDFGTGNLMTEVGDYDVFVARMRR
jgi:hypothetical protein